MVPEVDLDELIGEIAREAKNVADAYEWGSGTAIPQHYLDVAITKLKDFVDLKDQTITELQKAWQKEHDRVVVLEERCAYTKRCLDVIIQLYLEDSPSDGDNPGGNI